MSSQLTNMELLVDLHKNNDRQGPGSRETTELAMQLAGLNSGTPLRIADIGCGTGAASMVLADCLDAQVSCIDFLPAFLDVLETRAKAAGLRDRLCVINASMDALPFKDESFDVLWSEGAIYNIGFEEGIRSWKSYLKPGGVLAVSEITWTTQSRPEELHAYWDAAYPEVNTAAAKILQLESNGYRILGYFCLPDNCWIENYYQPLVDGYDAYLACHANSDAACNLIDAEKDEVALYRKFKDYYSYGMYIVQKT